MDSRTERCCCVLINKIKRFSKDDAGQASVEAAMLIPVLLALCLLLLQPACLLYTRQIMEATAAQAVRIATTSVDEKDIDAYCLRKLKAVPNLDIFHVKDSNDWEVTYAKDKELGTVQVCIKGHATPIPLLSLLSKQVLNSDEQGLILEVDVCEEIYPSWTEGDYESWCDSWG